MKVILSLPKFSKKRKTSVFEHFKFNLNNKKALLDFESAGLFRNMAVGFFGTTGEFIRIFVKMQKGLDTNY